MFLFVAFIAQYFLKQEIIDRYEAISNIIGKKAFWVFNPFTGVLEFGLFAYCQRDTGNFHFEIKNKNDGTIMEFAVTLAHLKEMNQEEDFINLFAAIDAVL